MKTFIKILTFVIIISSMTWTVAEKAKAQGVSVSFQLFYDQLSPYGTWIDDPSYGYVWVPNADPDFYPYASNGYWALTDAGWTWVSDYPWGWAAFHYGRWNYDNGFGWMWIPDVEWGPSWVVWRRSAGYYGWAPMGPGLTVSMAFGGAYSIPYDRWIFVRDGYMDRHDAYRYYLRRSDNYAVYQRSSVLMNTRVDMGRHTTYVFGPREDEYYRYTGRHVSPAALHDYNKPGHYAGNNGQYFYRPVVQKTNQTGHRPIPTKYEKRDDFRKDHEKNTNPTRNNNQQQPQKQQPQRQQPQQQQPQKQQPQRQQPQQQQPQKQQPQRQQPQKQQPQKQQPQRQQPQQQQPQKQQPQKQQPQRQQPQQQQPQKQQPQKQQPQQHQQQQPQQHQQQQPPNKGSQQGHYNNQPYGGNQQNSKQENDNKGRK